MQAVRRKVSAEPVPSASEASEKGVVCFTSFSLSYLAKARLLAWTIQQQQPNWHLVALVTDVPESKDVARSVSELFDEVVWSTTLLDEGFKSWVFQHNVVEACTAVKGLMLKRLLACGHQKVVYLDPDIAVFNSLQPIVDLLDQYSILLTPHQLSPERTAIGVRDNEIGSLKYGIFNLGFLAVRADIEGRRFADWWSQRLLEHCFEDVPGGVFTDQRWCDHVPVFFDGVHILKDPGYNVASWNLSNRVLSFTPEGCLVVNGSPLRFYHLTKFGPTGQAMTARYAKGNTAVYEVWSWYRMAVQRFVEPGIPSHGWAYGRYSSGGEISLAERRLYRDRKDLQRAFPDPFDSSAGGYERWYRSENR